MLVVRRTASESKPLARDMVGIWRVVFMAFLSDENVTPIGPGGKDFAIKPGEPAGKKKGICA
jgi:hypothetical protein